MKLQRRRSPLSLIGSVRCGGFVAALGWASLSHAATPVEQMRPAASAESHVVTEAAQVLPRWAVSAGVLTTYGQRVLDPSNARLTLDSRTVTHVLAALGLFDYAQLDVGVPLVIHQKGSDATGPRPRGVQAGAIGDVRTSLKGTFLRTPDRGVGLGLGFDLWAPTGSAAGLSSFGGWAYAPQLLFDARLNRGVETSINVGYMIRPTVRVDDLVLDDQLTYRAAARVPLTSRARVALVGEVDGGVGFKGAPSPVTVRGGFRLRLRSSMVIGLYAGGAPVSALGVPDFQVNVGLNFVPAHRIRRELAFYGNERPTATALARDHDRLVQVARAFEPQPTEVDPNDIDGDRFANAEDACPNVAEDHDGFEDTDGCPDYDDDGDGIRDAYDLCPRVPEVVNAYADWDGCPDVRLADGGRTLERFDPESVVPNVEFAPGSSTLREADAVALAELAELLRLNPWMGAIDLSPAVDFRETSPDAALLASARGIAIATFLADKGVDPTRLIVHPTRAARDPRRAVQIALGRPRRSTPGWSPTVPAPTPDLGVFAQGPDARDEAAALADDTAAQAHAPNPEAHGGPSGSQAPAPSGRTPNPSSSPSPVASPGTPAPTPTAPAPPPASTSQSSHVQGSEEAAPSPAPLPPVVDESAASAPR